MSVVYVAPEDEAHGPVVQVNSPPPLALTEKANNSSPQGSYKSGGSTGSKGAHKDYAVPANASTLNAHLLSDEPSSPSEPGTIGNSNTSPLLHSAPANGSNNVAGSPQRNKRDQHATTKSFARFSFDCFFTDATIRPADNDCASSFDIRCNDARCCYFASHSLESKRGSIWSQLFQHFWTETAFSSETHEAKETASKETSKF